MAGVFEGIKVVDFTWVYAGPMITAYLAKHGATVVRIESTTQPDITRTAAPYKDGIPGINRSGNYASHNPNKYDMTLDLNHPKGVEVVKRLVAWGDVVTENFSPGRMEQWGLGYEDLRRIKPDIIMLSTSNQGQTGPQAKRRGFGILLTSQVGFNSITGWPDRGPGNSWLGYTDVIAPRFAATALIAALALRRKTGKGLCLDISQLECALQFLAPLFLDYALTGREPRAMGNSCPHAAPHGAYRCAGDDRWCVISVFTDEEWEAFCNVLGNPEWARQSKFATLTSRKNNETELNDMVEEWTRKLTPEEVTRLMQEAGVPAGVVSNTQDLVEDPQLNSRNHLWWLDHKEIGSFGHMGTSVVLSRTPAEPRMAAPCLGEHTEYVCREFLGMSQEEFDAMLVDAVFG